LISHNWPFAVHSSLSQTIAYETAEPFIEAFFLNGGKMFAEF
jgi:hypothetical protein